MAADVEAAPVEGGTIVRRLDRQISGLDGTAERDRRGRCAGQNMSQGSAVTAHGAAVFSAECAALSQHPCRFERPPPPKNRTHPPRRPRSVFPILLHEPDRKNAPNIRSSYCK